MKNKLNRAKSNQNEYKKITMKTREKNIPGEETTVGGRAKEGLQSVWIVVL